MHFNVVGCLRKPRTVYKMSECKASLRCKLHMSLGGVVWSVHIRIHRNIVLQTTPIIIRDERICSNWFSKCLISPFLNLVPHILQQSAYRITFILHPS